MTRGLRAGDGLPSIIDAHAQPRSARGGCHMCGSTRRPKQRIRELPQAKGDSMELRVKSLRPSAKLPRRATPHATGLDLYACIDAPMTLTRHPQLVPCGIAIEVPIGYDGQVRPRSGLTSKGVGVAFGTIDADYRGEIFVTMWTFGDKATYEIADGDRIAQLVIVQLAPVEIVEAAELSATSRAEGGHGSTGR
jgi:dUTP pyrophosphatase